MSATKPEVCDCSPPRQGAWDKRKGLASLIVTAYGKLEYTKQCVESILQYTEKPYELILFDNGSADNTFEYFESIKKIHPDTVVVRNFENRVVEANSNYLHSLARGEYIVGISNDIILHTGWLPAFISQLNAAPDIGVVGPCSNNISGPQFVKADYKTFDEFHAFAEQWRTEHAGAAFDTNRMVGMAMIMKKEVNERIGGFDPDLATNGRDGGYGFSDDDFSLRMRMAGYRLRIAQDVFIHHSGSVTVKERPDIFGASQNLNKAKYEKKLRNNPRVTLTPRGELSFVPYKPGERIPIPDRMQIRFPRICILLLDDGSQKTDAGLYAELKNSYPLSVCRAKRSELLTTLRNLSENAENDFAVCVDTRFELPIDTLRSLIDAALRYPEVAIMAPLGSHAPSTHAPHAKTSSEIALIPYADLSVCAVNLKRVQHCFNWEASANDDALWFFQRRVRGEGFYIARANTVTLKVSSPVTSHPYDAKPLPETLFEKKDFAEAAAIYQHDGEQDPGFFDSVYQLGRIAYETGKQEEAIACFNRVLELDPHHISAIIHLAKMYLGAKNLDQAEQAVRLAYAKQPRNNEVMELVKQLEILIGPAPKQDPPRAPLLKPAQKGFTSIIIIGEQSRDDLETCVTSIQKHTPEPHEILFIDTGYTEKTRTWLNSVLRNNPQHRVLKSSTSGDASACNLGIKASSGEYIVLLSPALEVTEHWLSGMLECLQSAPDIGIVGPMTNSSSGPPKAPVPESTPSNLTEFARAFHEQHRNRRIPQRHIDGCCMLFNRNLIDAVGLFDETLDSDTIAHDDFCLRAELLGHQNAIAGDIFIYQHGGTVATLATSSVSRTLLSNKWSRIGSNTMLGKKLLSLHAQDKARELLHKEQLAQAVEALFEALRHSPEERSLCYLAAEMLIETKQFGDAHQLLTQMLPGDADAQKLLLLGYAEEGLGHDDKALEYAERALALLGKSALALNLKGLVAYKRGDKAHAEKFCKQAIETDPGYGEPYTNLGTLAWAADKKQEALDLLERGFMLSPTVPDIIAAYHAAVTALNAFERAEVMFQEAHALWPQNQKLAFLLIDILLKQEKYAKAMQEIEQAMLLFGIDDGILAAALDVRSKLGPLTIDAAARTRGTLSLCMIVKNEEQHLLKCLMSVKPVVDEMIIVDTGSTDKTKELATALGAKVFDATWNNDFSAARNASLEKASGDWILVLDADEVISPLDHAELAKLTAQKAPPKTAYFFTTRNYVVPVHLTGWTALDRKYLAEEAGTGWFGSVKVRLFSRHDQIRFVNPVHELVELSLQKLGVAIQTCGIPIHHYGKLNNEKVLSKGEDYYQLGRKKLETQGNDANAIRELGIQAAELGKLEEALDLFKRVAALKPDMVAVHLNLGSLYLEMERYPEALEASNKAVKLAPQMKEASYNLALSELYNGHVSRAIAVLTDLTQKQPDYHVATFMLAIACCCNDDKKRGHALFKKLHAVGFHFIESLHWVAKKLIAAQQVPYAVSLLDAAIEAGESNDAIRLLQDELTGKKNSPSNARKNGLTSILLFMTDSSAHPEDCVDSIRKHTPEPHEIILLNASSDQSRRKRLLQLFKDHPTDILLAIDPDSSFAETGNQGIRAAKGDFILLLDSNSLVTPGWLTGMLDCLGSSSDIGLVGPMTNQSSSVQKVSAVEYTSIEGLEQFARQFRERHLQRRVAHRHVDGFCMLFARGLLDQLGLLDEKFGPNNFDDDYCLRAEILGYRNFIAGDVFIHLNDEGVSFAENKPSLPLPPKDWKPFIDKWGNVDANTSLGKKMQVAHTKGKAEEMYQRGSLAAAIEVLLDALRHSPEERRLCYLAAEMLIEAKQFSDAHTLLTEMLPGDADARKLLLLGYAEEGLGHDDKALEYAERGSALHGKSALALNLKGLVAYKKGNKAEAEKFCKQAIETDPGYGEPYTNLGTLAWAADKKQEALDLLERGFMLSPTIPDIIAAYHAAVTALSAFGRAEVMFQEAHALWPQNQKLAFLLIDILLKQEKYGQAMQEIEQAMLLFGIDDGILAAALDVRSKLGPLTIDAAAKTRGTLSLCMIVKNEEQHLLKCLMSVKPVVDEMILVDTGSTDKTKQIATALGAKVFDATWNNDFSAARNASLEKASGDWILVLDADEVISSLDHAELAKLTAQHNGKTAYSFVTRNYMLSQQVTGWTAHDRKYVAEEAGAGWHPSDKVRLFPRDDKIRFTNPVHEFVEPSLQKLDIPIKPCAIPVHHYGKLNRDKVLSKGEEYYLLGRKKLEEKKNDAQALSELAIQAGELNRFDEAIELWEQVLKLQPDMLLAYLNLQTLYREKNRFPEALVASRKAFELAPSSKEASYGLALSELYMGNTTRAIKLLDELVIKEPDYPPAKIMLPMAHGCEKHTRKHAADLFIALKSRGINSSAALTDVAKKLIAAKQANAAISLLDTARETSTIAEEQALDLLEQGFAFFPDDALLASLLAIRKRVGPLTIDAKKKAPTLSLCMIVKNEEQHLPKCLMSVKPVVDEIIVVDTGSTDRTKEIATALGARVFDYPWTNDFSAARNESLKKAAGDWVLVLDADEVLSPLDHAELKRLITNQTPKKIAYAFNTRNYASLIDTTGWTANDRAYPQEEAGSGWFGSAKVRLFQRDARIRFVNPVHELLEPSLQQLGIAIQDSSIPIHHYGKLNKEKTLSKGEEYYQLGKKKLAESGDNAHAVQELAIQAGALKKFEEAIDLWNKAIALGGDKEKAYLNLASLHLQREHYGEALDAAKKSVAGTPVLKESITNYALCELYAGDAQKALAGLENLLKKHPDYPAAKIIAGIAYLSVGRIEDGNRIFASLGLRGAHLAEAALPFAKTLLKVSRTEYANRLLDALEESNASTKEVAELRAESAKRS